MSNKNTMPLSFDELENEKRARDEKLIIEQSAGLVQNIANADIDNKKGALVNLFDQVVKRLKSGKPFASDDKKVHLSTECKVEDKTLKNEVDQPDTKKDDTLNTNVSKSDLMFFKSDDDSDQTMWAAIYSNNFRDRDNVPEIISEASHKRFDTMLKSGNADYPELWLYHIKGTRWGKAIFHAYDDNGFSLAAGYVDKGKEWVVEHLKNSGVKLGVSHGMPKQSLKYDSQDKTIITEHVTIEISPLPLGMAANKLTQFVLDSEDKSMALSDDDRKKLQEMKFDDGKIESIESAIELMASSAKDTGIESKGVSTQTDNSSNELKGLNDKFDLFNKNIGDVLKANAEVLAELVRRVSAIEKVENTEKEKSDLSSGNFDVNSFYKKILGSSSSTSVISDDDELAKGPKQTKSNASNGSGVLEGLGWGGFIRGENNE